MLYALKPLEHLKAQGERLPLSRHNFRRDSVRAPCVCRPAHRRG